MSYCRKIMKKSMAPNLISAFLIYGFSTISAMIISDKTLHDFLPSIIISLFIVIISQFVLFPIIIRIVFSAFQRRINQFYNESTSEKTRTKLFEDLMTNPAINAVITFCIFIAQSFIIYFIYKTKVGLSEIPNTIALVECIYSSFFSAFFAYGYTNRIVSSYAIEIVQSGIDKNYVIQKKHFGMDLHMQIMIYYVIPLSLSLILINLISSGCFKTQGSSQLIIYSSYRSRIILMGFICLVVTAVQTAMSIFFFMRLKRSNEKMSSILGAMEDNNLKQAKYVETDIEDEVGLNHYLANNMLSLLQETLNKFEEIGIAINEYSINLNQISTETNATYMQQSSGTTEITSSMKITTERAHQIKEKIAEVARLAKDTENDVQNGNQVLNRYYDNIKHIDEHNKETIQGINELNNRINKIWEVVKIINSIADQTKIIAFNAELESSGIQKKGNNFKNVSNEIRRLANSTMDSTREIKERINIIQDSSEELKESLEDTIPLITRGRNLVEELKGNFDNILASTNSNAEAASHVSGLISEQTNVFEQISNTLEQITNSLQNFEEATTTISRSSQEMQKSAEELGHINAAGVTNE